MNADHARVGHLSHLRQENAVLAGDLTLQREQGALAAQLPELETPDAAISLELRALRKELDERALQLSQVPSSNFSRSRTRPKSTAHARTPCRQNATVRQATSMMAAEHDRIRDEIVQDQLREEAIRAERDQARHRLDDLFRSRSWRWTAPARALLDLLKVQ